MRRPGIYWHALPTYAQGRKIVWEGRTKEGRPFLDAFPPELVVRKREDEMMLWLRNGSIYQVVGADQVNSLVGTNPVGIVLSEYALHDPNFWELMLPVLIENGGWALFIYTPRGRNHGWDLYQAAKKHPEDWFCQLQTIEDTRAVSLSDVAAARAAGWPEEKVQQEFYCSFDVALVGSYFGSLVARLRAENRIGSFPYDAKYPVDTGWDIGIGDSTAIWCGQQVGAFFRLLSYYEAAGAGVDHYIKWLHERPFTFGKHYWPHDGAAAEWGTGQTRQETARTLGLRASITPRVSIDDGIQATRNLLSVAQIHEPDCERGLRALAEYTKEWDDEKKMYLERPLHNWASHGANALKSMGLGRKSPERRTGADFDLKRRRPAIV